MSAMAQVEGQLRVVSDGSKKLKADLQTGYTDRLFIRSPQSAKADNRTGTDIQLTISS